MPGVVPTQSREQRIHSKFAQAAPSPNPSNRVRDQNECNSVDDVDKAILACSRILASTTAKEERALMYAARATLHYIKRDFDSSIADFSRAIGLAPTFRDAYYLRGMASQSKGIYDQAISDYNLAIKLDPKNAGYYGARGTAWSIRGEFALAMSDLNKAVALRPNDSASYENRAIVWNKIGNFQQAVFDLSLAISSNPNSSTAYISRGRAERMLGDLGRALADQTKAIQLRPSAPAFNERGETFRYRGEYDRALEDYGRALELTPDHIGVFVGRGLTYEKMGNASLARMEFSKALISTMPERGAFTSELDTAKARLAALNSAVQAPPIPAAPLNVSNQSSIPTLPVAISSPPADRVQATASAVGRRVALVIGNSAYKNIGPLANPKNDAVAIAASLKNIGFASVRLVTDTSREVLANELKAFASEVKAADWAVVYYAGHGIEADGINYLVPIDAQFGDGHDLRLGSTSLNHVMESVDGAKKLKLIILDACRNNPYSPSPTSAVSANSTESSAKDGRTVRARAVGRGLAEVKVQGATLVVFAAKHGQFALDGEGPDSPFTIALVQRIATPGVEINKLFRLVRDDVMEATAGRQEPYTYGSLPGREDLFFLK